MMREVVSCARHGETPPPILVLAWDVNRWKVLPDSGGLLDQDYKMMHDIRVSLNIYDMIAKLISLKGDKIYTLTEPERKFIRQLMDMGVFHG